MKVIYSDQPIPLYLGSKSIFLAGPTPRDMETPSWRPEALDILTVMDYRGTVLVPERTVKKAHINYDDQVEWEDEGLNKCQWIVFWVPRDLQTMPAFTTNVEFGRFANQPKTLYGRPDDAPKNRYLDWLYMKYNKSNIIYKNLTDLLKKASL